MENFRIGSVKYTEEKIKLSFYYNTEKGNFNGAIEGTPFVLYVTGTKTERIGTAPDSEIILGFINDGYAVCVADYSDCTKSAPPELEYSVQELLNKLRSGNLAEEGTFFYQNRCREVYVVPSGYSLTRNIVFWSFDKHSADGTLEKIVNIWNNDFRAVRGDILVLWTDKNGERKPVQNGFDGSEPVWCDKNGEPDEKGSYIRLKHTKPEKISHCTKRNGEPLNLDLAMDICYPVRPKRAVPVMCLLSSADTRCDTAAVADRPHYHGFLFRGYAGVLVDYGYTPMAQVRHYPQFDGCGPLSITGDNVTYSMSFYNDTAINSATMRCIRYLNETDSRYSFLNDSIGIIGTSKGGWATFLGMENPEEHMPHRYLKGHSGETRFEAGKTETEEGIRGGEEQPFLYANGKKLSSRANFVFPACGGCPTDIYKGNSPMYVDCHLGDRSGYWNSASFVSLCRDCDIPAIVSTLDLGHTMCYNNDIHNDFDAYGALFDFAGYFLNNKPVKVLYNSADNSGLHIKFTGSVLKNEIEKIKLYCGEKEVRFKSLAEFGNTLWSFIPDVCGELRAVIPSDLKGTNGEFIGSEYSFQYTQPEIEIKIPENTAKTVHIGLSDLETEYGDNLRYQQETVCGKDSVKITVSTNISREGKPQFVNHEYYYNHGPYSDGNVVTVNNILSDKPFTDKDIGKKYKITVCVFDTASREVQLSLSSGYDIEKRIIDYNKAIRNFRTVENEWTNLELEYTVTEPFESVPKKLFISVASTGVSEKPIYVADICILKYEDFT